MNTGSVLARFTITLSTAVTEPVQVEWHTSDGTAKASVDYAANKGTVVFAPGETAKTVDILVYGRAVGAEDRSFYVEMLPPTNAILGASIGECIIHVDTTGSTPVTQIIIPTGPQGIQGKSAYQSYVDTTTDNPPMTEPEWVESLKGDPAEIAQEVAPLIDVGDTTLVAEGTETLSKPDSTTVKAVARRVAYASPAKIATVTLADGDNYVGQSDMTGDTIDLGSDGLYPRIVRGSTVITPSWGVQPDGKILIKNAIAGDVLYVCQYDLTSRKNINSNMRENWRRVMADAGLNLVDGSFEDGATVNNSKDAVWHMAGGQCYSWSGALPKTVGVNSNPGATGGVSSGAWIKSAFHGSYIKRTTVADLSLGTFPVGTQLLLTDRAEGKFAVVAGGTPNGTYILDAGNGNTAVYQIPADGFVNVKALGGKSGVDSSAAVLAAHSLSNLVYYPDNDVYQISYDVNTANRSFVTYNGQTGIRITGSAATIKDVSVFAVGTNYLVDIFKFVACKDVYINVNFDATPLPDLTAPPPEGLGYKGSSAIYLEGFCEHVTVDNRMSNVRYGVRQGGYSNPAFGGANNIRLRTRCLQVGYPIVSYTASNLDLDIDSNIQHRAAYLSGCINVRGTIAFAGYTYAEIGVVFGDSISVVSDTDADRRVNSCRNIKLNIVDRGSVNNLTNRAACGITQSWRAPNVAHNNIHLHLQLKTNNATRTLAGFRLQSVPGVGWMAGNIYSDIKVSGVIDRVEQTMSGSQWADYSIIGIEDGETGPYPNSPTFDGIDFSELRIVNGSVTGNISKLLVPNATGVINLKNARQGISLTVNAPNARVILTNAALAAVSGAGIIFPTRKTGDNGWRIDDDGFLSQWMKVYYNVAANTDQTFHFPKSFQSAVNPPDIQSDATGRTFAFKGVSLTGVTVSCSVAPITLFIKVNGY